MWTMLLLITVIKTITWLLLSKLQGNKPHRNSPEPSEPLPPILYQHSPELFGTLRNFPNPAFGTYTNTRRNSPEPSRTFQDLPEPTFRNLPEPTSGTYASIRRNRPEPSGTRLRNLHQHTPELSGTFRNLPESSSGTCSCDPHRHTPVLIWAEDPISLRCWGKKVQKSAEEFKISFGDIPNSSSSIDLVPSLTTLAPFCAVVLPMWTMLLLITVIKTITWLLLSKLQGNKPHRNSPEPEPCLQNLHQHVPELSRTLQNLPRPSGTNLSESSGTYYLRNLRQHTPEPSEIFRNLLGTCLRNLPRPASGTYTSIRRNPAEPSGNRLRNLHQHTPELSGTFRNLPPEPAPATRTGTHRSLSGLKTPLAYAVGEKKNSEQ